MAQNCLKVYLAEPSFHSHLFPTHTIVITLGMRGDVVMSQILTHGDLIVRSPNLHKLA